MNAQQFLDKNKLINCTRLCELLEVSSNTVTKMKTNVTRIQSLALDALDKEQRDLNLISLDITEWFDKTYGNTYFSGYVLFKGKRYFLPIQYGYGSHCEDMALKLLLDEGVLPVDTSRRWVLSNEYNINIKTSTCDVSRKGDMYDGSHI